MRSDILAEFVDKFVMLAAGVGITLVGFRILGTRPGQSLSADAWHARVGGLFRIGGPLLILVGGLLSINAFLRGLLPPELPDNIKWKRFASSDEFCSAEFPLPPTHEIKQSGDVPLDSQTLYIRSCDAYYAMSFSELPGPLKDASTDQILDLMQESLLSTKTPTGDFFELVNATDVETASLMGRELEYSLGKNTYSIARFFVVQGRIYRVVAAYPRSESLEKAARRFVDSLAFESQHSSQ